MTWQDISTAPRDGSEVELGWRPDGVTEHIRPARWVDGNWIPRHETGFYVGATHWRRPRRFPTRRPRRSR